MHNFGLLYIYSIDEILPVYDVIACQLFLMYTENVSFSFLSLMISGSVTIGERCGVCRGSSRHALNYHPFQIYRSFSAHAQLYTLWRACRLSYTPCDGRVAKARWPK